MAEARPVGEEIKEPAASAGAEPGPVSVAARLACYFGDVIKNAAALTRLVYTCTGLHLFVQQFSLPGESHVTCWAQRKTQAVAGVAAFPFAQECAFLD